MKQFKKKKVVMLPTNEKAKVGMINLEHYNKEGFKLELIHYVTNGDGLHPQHLYITSDEEIKEGDWVYSEGLHYVFQVLVFPLSAKDAKKIIATTDTSLNLPQPSQQLIEKYIEEYNKGNQIKEVMVEYETTQITKQEWFQEAPYRVKYDVNTLKVKSDNTITIRKTKDSWNREEVRELCRLAYNLPSQDVGPFGFDKWIEENL
jgi:hypothetical protein